MSAVEIAVERVKTLPEEKAQLLLTWLDHLEAFHDPNTSQRRGARAALGFAHRFHPPQTTSDWMKELREGEA